MELAVNYKDHINVEGMILKGENLSKQGENMFALTNIEDKNKSQLRINYNNHKLEVLIKRQV